jgi:DNA-binding LacI/PurR family transcriptional regulator
MISEAANSEPQQKALHEEIEEIICAGIRNGQLKPGQKLVLVDQMVKRRKVSRATVQHAMQVLAAKGLIVRKPKAGTFISEGVLDIAGGGWRKTRSICLIVPALQNVEFAALARGVEDAAHDNNLSVIVSSTDNDPGRYEQVITRHIDSGVLGIFMVPPLGYRLPLLLLEKLQKSEIPVVTCFRSLNEVMGWPLIRTDAYHAMFTTTAHLAKIGRKRIAFVGYKAPPEPAFQGINVDNLGFRMGLLENNLHTDASLELLLDCQEGLNLMGQTQFDSMSKWFSEHPDLDGVCCCHDLIASTAMAALRQQGRRIPEDVAVTGRGNFGCYLGFDLSELTTIDMNSKEFGRVFFEMVTAMSFGQSSIPPFTEIKGRLIIGRSSTTSVSL